MWTAQRECRRRSGWMKMGRCSIFEHERMFFQRECGQIKYYEYNIYYDLRRHGWSSG